MHFIENISKCMFYMCFYLYVCKTNITIGFYGLLKQRHYENIIYYYRNRKQVN